MESVLKNVFIQSMGESTTADSDLRTRHFANPEAPKCMNNSSVLKVTAL